MVAPAPTATRTRTKRTPPPDASTDDLAARLSRQEIQAGEDEAAKVEADRLRKKWPEPDLGYVDELRRHLEAQLDVYRNGDESSGVKGLKQVRDMRYQRDVMDPKWQQRLEGSTRFRSRLSHNEILRVAAMMTRNSPKITIQPAGDAPGAADKAAQETRWANAVLEQLTRDSGKPLLRMFADSLVESGLAVWEVYLTDSYDHIKFEHDGEESDAQYGARVDPQLMAARAPANVRLIDSLAVLTLPGDAPGGIDATMIVETKPRRLVQRELERDLSDADLERLRNPGANTPGHPIMRTGATDSVGMAGSSETVKYYDGYWYAYVVDGAFVDGPRPHNQPGMPIIAALGMVTSSSNLSEQIEGITWGMTDMEQSVNDIITYKLDTQMVYGRPAPVVEMDEEGDAGGVKEIDLSDPKKAPVLPRGGHIADANQHFRDEDASPLLNLILSLFQRSGLNPIAQGESPGADPAGYTVNSLTSSAQALYEIILDNFARAIGMLIDHLRQMIKKGPIKEKWYVSAMNAEGTGREFICLGPDEVTDVACEVTIDPMSDVNRLALRQSLIDGYGKRLVPRRIVQQLGYGAEDVDEWDDEIVEDLAFERLANMAVDEAIAIVAGAYQDPARPTILGPDGQPLPPSNGGAGGGAGGPGGPAGDNGAEPADTQAPSVGAGARGAGGAPISPTGNHRFANNAGQGSGGTRSAGSRG